MNEYWERWYETIQILEELPNDTNEPGLSHDKVVAGGATLAASYIAAGLLIKSKNPYAMTLGGAILLIPDPVIFGIGYYLS
jgi:hypothetical protein